MATKQVKISYLNIDLKTEVVRIPVHWLGFKNYYTKNGKYPNNVTWMEPLLDIDNMRYNDILEYYENQNADVYAFSCFLWNHIAVMSLAEDLKKSNPNRIIILGGPHLNVTHNNIDWFFKHRFVDAICDPTSYGEMFINDMLDQMVEGDKINWKEVSFSVYRTGRGKTPNKREFKFPGGIIKGNEDIVFKCKEIADKNNLGLTLPLELTRGCPYECVFCEWGGGIGGKVIRKPQELVYEDLDQIPLFGINYVQILDANLGIYKEDAEVTEYLENMKNIFDLPTYVEIYGMTKSSPEKKWKTFEPLARSGLTERYKISLQSLDETVLANIKRKNVPMDSDIEYAKYLYKQYQVRADLEFIMGLPGHTRELFYDEVDVQYDHGYTLERYMWMLLPDSPAYDPEYKKKFNIETIRLSVSKSRSLGSQQFDDYDRTKRYHITEDPLYKSDVEIVVKADGYTKDDYVEFMFMNHWVIQSWIKTKKEATDRDGEYIFKLPQLIDENIKLGNIEKPSCFFKQLYKNILEVENNEYVYAMRELVAEISDIVHGRQKHISEFKYYKLPYTDEVVEVTYLLRTCIFTFHDHYIDLLLKTCDDLGMVVSKDYVDSYLLNISDIETSKSKNFDTGYRILNFYENFIRQRNAKSIEIG
jgi:radical SAM superfamily enzyme YgiQ (UPF0313 family)